MAILFPGREAGRLRPVLQAAEILHVTPLTCSESSRGRCPSLPPAHLTAFLSCPRNLPWSSKAPMGEGHVSRGPEGGHGAESLSRAFWLHPNNQAGALTLIFSKF